MQRILLFFLSFILVTPIHASSDDASSDVILYYEPLPMFHSQWQVVPLDQAQEVFTALEAGIGKGVITSPVKQQLKEFKLSDITGDCAAFIQLSKNPMSVLVAKGSTFDEDQKAYNIGIAVFNDSDAMDFVYKPPTPKRSPHRWLEGVEESDDEPDDASSVPKLILRPLISDEEIEPFIKKTLGIQITR